LLRPALNPSRT